MAEESLEIGGLLDLNVEKIVFGGDALARTEAGMVVFVPFAAPGDRLRVRIIRKKAKVAWASIEQILQRGPGRQEAPCKYYLKCGGCQYQHLTYDEECRVKESQVREALKREAKIEDAPVLPLIKSPRDLGYRNRIIVHVGRDREAVGFNDVTGRNLVDIDKCLLASDEVNAQLTELRKNPLAGQHYSLRERAVPRSGFFQANSSLLETLRERVVGAFSPGDLLLEGYCGGGFFTEPLAAKFKQVKAVDNDPRTLKDAQRLGLKSVEWILGDAGTDFSTLVMERSSLGASVLLDPPREGLPDTVTNALVFQPVPHLVYVSCDPATFSRDARILSKKYRLEWVQPIDMFPRTSQIEIVSSWKALNTAS